MARLLICICWTNVSREGDTMVTKNIAGTRSSSEARIPNCRCSICGKTMKTPQEILSLDNQQYCDACYHDNFFANAKSSHRLMLDRYDR